MILTIAEASDPWALRVRDTLERKGIKNRWVEHSKVLTTLGINWKMDQLSSMDGSYFSIGSDHIPFANLTGVFIRPQLSDVSASLQEMDQGNREYVHKELFSTFLGLWQALPCPVINRPVPGTFNVLGITNVNRRRLIREHGFCLPDCHVSSVPLEAADTFDAWEQSAFMVGLHSRSLGHLLEGPSGKDFLLEQTKIQSLILQKVPQPAEWFSVFTIGETAIGATGHVPWGNTTKKHAALQSCEIPEDLQSQCCNLAQALRLDFSEGLYVRDTKGQIYCFDITGSPRYEPLDEPLRQRITDEICQYLHQGERKPRNDSLVGCSDRASHG